MGCLLQNLTLFLLLFQPQSATDELIPPTPGKDSWDFWKGSGWNCNNQGCHRFITHLWYFTLSRAWKNTSEYSSFLRKLSVFPRTCFSYINSCKVCSQGGGNLSEQVFTPFCRYKLSHLLSMCIPCRMEICLFCCLIPPFWKFSKYPLTHLTSTTCIHRLIYSKFLSVFSE